MTMFSKNVFVFCVMASLSIQCVCILRRAQLLAPNILDHLKEPVLFQEQSLQRLEGCCFLKGFIGFVVGFVVWT